MLCLTLGAMLRMQAGNMAGKAASGINAVNMFKSMSGEDGGSLSDTMVLAQRSNALHDIAQVMLWTGGALLVVAAVALLFLPAWMAHRAPAGEPGHPVLSTLP